jgi:hypothetical protein
MSLFEFITGMISVIFALAIAQMFVGVAELVQHRGKLDCEGAGRTCSLTYRVMRSPTRSDDEFRFSVCSARV